MKRRDFMKLAAAGCLVTTLPAWATAAFAAPAPKLPIPPLLEPDASGGFTLTVQTGKTSFSSTSPASTWGFNGPLLGPSLRLRRGKNTKITVRNTLTELVAVHWHGMELPGIADGGPQAAINPGSVWEAAFTVDQPAATCWFHPHTHGQTGHQVAMGLGGLLIVEDDTRDTLKLPQRWGVDDIPVILQDKRFNAAGQVDYALDMMTAAVGWFGNIMLTNGTLQPEHKSPKGWIRLRLLNGCNARSLKLAISDNRPMYVIASDGGYLSSPVKMQELPIFMGERFEVLIDASDGKPFELITLPVQQVGMTLPPFDAALPVLRVVPGTETSSGTLPDALATLPGLPATLSLPIRTLALSMDPKLDMEGMQLLVDKYGEKALAGFSMDAHGGHGAPQPQTSHAAHGTPPPPSAHAEHETSPAFNLYTANKINGQAFMMNVPAFDVKLGQYERWIITSENDIMLHPFHIHGTQFRILSENGKPPAEHRSGWKDVVVVENSKSEVLVKFAHPAPKERAFMAHCHLLEHEDTGMMLSFTVSK